MTNVTDNLRSLSAQYAQQIPVTQTGTEYVMSNGNQKSIGSSKPVVNTEGQA